MTQEELEQFILDYMDEHIEERIAQMTDDVIDQRIRQYMEENGAAVENNGSDGEVPLVSDDYFTANDGQHMTDTSLPMVANVGGVQVSFIQARIRAFALAAASLISASDVATPVVPQNSNNVTIDPNVLNTWDTDTEGMASLTVAFNTGTAGKVNEYMLRVYVVTTPFTLTLPAGVTWADGETPTFESDTTYEISIINNLAVYAAF